MFCNNCGSVLEKGNPTCPSCGVNAGASEPGPKTKFCYKCGSQIEWAANRCMHCGVTTPTPGEGAPRTARDPVAQALVPDVGKSWLVALLLACTVGVFGIHRFYAGKIFTGILQFVTAGGFGIWWLIDVALIATDNFRDADGLKLTK